MGKKTAQKAKGSLVRVVTNSEIGTATCIRAWAFKYIHGLNAGLSRAPLITGGLWGDVMDAYWGSNFEITTSEMNVGVVDPWLQKRMGYYAEAGLNPYEYAEKAAETEAQAELVLGMFAGYAQTWRAKDKEDWEVIAIEPQVARWIINPETGKTLVDYVTVTEMRDGVPTEVRRRRLWCYGGKVDKVARKRCDGTYWDFEHKSTIEKNLERFHEKLVFDPQIRGYPWAQKKLIPQLSKGIYEPIQITGVVYDTARKTVPRRPTLLETCTCKHPRSKHFEGGCDGSQKCGCRCFQSIGVSTKATVVTTKNLFRRTLLENGIDPDEEKYRDFADKLPDIDAFFRREEVPMSDFDLDDFEANMTAHAINLLDWSKRAFHPRNQANCTKSGAYPCDYRSPCINDGPGTRSAFTVMTIRHPELEDALAEPFAGKERGVLDDIDAEMKAEAEALIRIKRKDLPVETDDDDDDIDFDSWSGWGDRQVEDEKPEPEYDW